MRPYLVTYEIGGHTNDKAITDNELSEQEAAGFTQTARKENTLPANVLAVVSGHISEDDGQADSDIHVFVSITLRIWAGSKESAGAFPAPHALLTTITDAMATNQDSENNLVIDGAWEITDTSEPSPTYDDLCMRMIGRAREAYVDSSGNVGIDADARLSESEEGTWVEAWHLTGCAADTDAEACIEIARDTFGSDNVEFDGDAKFSPTSDNTWVQGWVWVSYTKDDLAFMKAMDEGEAQTTA